MNQILLFLLLFILLPANSRFSTPLISPFPATMICIDNSEWTCNGDYSPTRFQSQADAVKLICGAKTQELGFHPSLRLSGDSKAQMTGLDGV